MFRKTLDEKPFVLVGDNIEIRDLTQSAINKKLTTYLDYNIYKVPEEYEMRPDLISLAVYNSAAHTEIILKFNNISNPFSIEKNDIILIPDLNSALNQFKTSAAILNDSVSERIRKSYKYIDPLKAPTSKQNVYANRQLIDVHDGALPPNLAKKGESQVTYRNGKVIFGAEGEDPAIVTQTCLKSGISTGEFLTQVIKRKKANL